MVSKNYRSYVIYNRLHKVLTWRAATTVAAGAADAVLQPGAVGEGVALVRRPG